MAAVNVSVCEWFSTNNWKHGGSENNDGVFSLSKKRVEGEYSRVSLCLGVRMEQCDVEIREERMK